MLISCLRVSANTYSQKLNLTLKNASFSQAFSAIEQKTRFRILYSDDLLPENTVNVEVRNEPLTNVLNHILYGSNLTYKVLDNKVIVISRTDAKFQAKTISGTVTDTSGNPLSGVSVMVKGTSKGTVTNAAGVYSIDVPDNNVTLVFVYVGYTIQEIPVNGDTVDVSLIPLEAAAGNDVVVTALGIKRSERDLTYSTQQIGGDELTRVKHTNLINSLNGKVAGLTINANGSGVGGSSKVVLRGSKSLLGNNQALYVIDGIPMNNNTTNQPSTGFGGTTSYDGGDPISNLNPDDIESITVLKGASASALYGGAGGNGVILITTKSGKNGKTQINFSSGATLNKIAYKPDFQNSYGQSLTTDGKGIDSTSIYSWGNPTSNSQDNLSQFFQTGNDFTNSISLSSGSKIAQSYFSYANTTSRGIEPGNKLQRNNFNFKEIGHFLNDKLTVDVNTNYITQNIDNSPNAGFYFNPLTGLYLFPRGRNIAQYKSMYEVPDVATGVPVQNWFDITPENDGSLQFGDDIQQNPWWIINRNTNALQRNRLILNAIVKYDFSSWFNLQARGSIDRINDIYDQKLYATTNPVVSGSNGKYYYSNGVSTQKYGDLIGNFNFSINNSVKITGLVGTSINDSKTVGRFYGSSGSVGLYYPNVFTLQNTITDPATTQDMPENHLQVQSVFASANIAYKDELYLDVTGRNDWSSSLSNTKDGYSFFYPSIGANALLNKIFKMPQSISLAKVRASYAEVGLAPLPYQSNPPIATIGSGGNASLNNTSPATALAPQKTKSWEIGTQWRFLGDRLGLDFTYYNTNTRNQTIQINQSVPTFYGNGYVIAGNIRNRGVELTINYDLISSSDFKWNTAVNYSFNQNKVLELAPGITQSILTGSGNGAQYVSMVKVGGSLGDIYGNVLQKDAQGRILIDSVSKSPIPTSADTSLLGNPNPKWQLGWNNNFTYKNFSLSFLVDGQFGGKVMSVTQQVMDGYGVSAITGAARSAGGVKINGAYQNGTPVTSVDAEKWYTTVGNRNGVAGEYMYSATVVRLREISLGYSLPIKSSVIKALKFSVIGSNLVYFYKKAPFDPGLTMSTGNGFSGVDIFMPPATRNFGLSLNATF